MEQSAFRHLKNMNNKNTIGLNFDKFTRASNNKIQDIFVFKANTTSTKIYAKAAEVIAKHILERPVIVIDSDASPKNFRKIQDYFKKNHFMLNTTNSKQLYTFGEGSHGTVMSALNDIKDKSKDMLIYTNKEGWITSLLKMLQHS